MAESPEAPLFDKLERDAFDSDRLRCGPWAAAGALLQAPGAILRDLNRQRNLGAYLASLAAATLCFTAAYGAVMGLFQPGLQTLYAALKLPIVVLGSALLCTPTFYVFNAILGSPFTFLQTLVAVLFLAAAAALVLVAFVPIAWFFTVSTGAAAFLRILHLGVFLIAALYGLRSLNTGRKYLAYVNAARPPIHGGFLALWFGVLLFVALQMAYTFRPLLLPGPFHSGERGLFLEALEPRGF